MRFYLDGQLSPTCQQSSFSVFDVHVTVHRAKFLIKNQLNALISQIYFWNKTLHVSDSSFVHHQEFLTVHTATVYVIQICRQRASRIRMERPDPARKLGLRNETDVCEKQK
jgi:hypothetical protein